jgi:hypothetical protein
MPTLSEAILTEEQQTCGNWSLVLDLVRRPIARRFLGCIFVPRQRRPAAEFTVCAVLMPQRPPCATLPAVPERGPSRPAADSAKPFATQPARTSLASRASVAQTSCLPCRRHSCRQTLINTLSSGRKPNQSRLKALRYGRQECLGYAKHAHSSQPAAVRDVPRAAARCRAFCLDGSPPQWSIS